MSIRVIVMDVDGTMSNHKKEITPKTKAALKKAQESGVKIILASGRPDSGLSDFAIELEMGRHHGLLVSFNGSRVTDCQTGEVLFNETMTVEQGKAVLEHMKGFNVRPMIDKGKYMYVNDVYDCMIKNGEQEINIIQYESRGGKYKLCEMDDLAAFVDYPLNKILTAGDSIYLKEHYREMMEPFKDTLNCMFTAPFYFEFTAQGIDKAKALEAVLSPMGYMQDEIIAFGDGQNDKTMIQYAGIGVAMDNAVEELKEVADEITLSNEDDGIAVSLYKHIPGLV
ncbi:Cof-type HAD-IIB family hydrolase [Lacrimispora celerecrescens]|uniref:HAD family hydrolase n=1 Tax=Lacrimispora celerecrescens TaxID=29354 RepID=A0A084JMK7_9FIRM|nr:Cof-type HAD-IIB family hydrolase [Lacrimispora celerecrescens]KEZ90191.1 HAD family hydrolase [Lacrimispora celerecrescens]